MKTGTSSMPLWHLKQLEFGYRAKAITSPYEVLAKENHKKADYYRQKIQDLKNRKGN